MVVSGLTGFEVRVFGGVWWWWVEDIEEEFWVVWVRVGGEIEGLSVRGERGKRQRLAEGPGQLLQDFLRQRQRPHEHRPPNGDVCG